MSFAPFKSAKYQWSLPPRTHIFRSEYLRKVGNFSETEQVRGHREEQNYKTGGNIKVDTQPPKLKVFGFSDPA